MQFTARAKYISCSPYKLRPLADVIRRMARENKSVRYALAWLEANESRRTRSLQKVVSSAVANAQHMKQIDVDALMVRAITVDQGPIQDYFKPGAQGRAMPQRRRLSHIQVVLETKDKEASRGSKG